MSQNFAIPGLMEMQTPIYDAVTASSLPRVVISVRDIAVTAGAIVFDAVVGITAVIIRRLGSDKDSVTIDSAGIVFEDGTYTVDFDAGCLGCGVFTLHAYEDNSKVAEGLFEILVG
jgi:hypothetical protein